MMWNGENGGREGPWMPLASNKKERPMGQGAFRDEFRGTKDAVGLISMFAF